jgi:uncharacterized protein YcbK (DUF882 family)
MPVSRRLVLAAIAAAPLRNAAAAAAAPRGLAFEHLHTGETLRLEHRGAQAWPADALGAANRLLRDFRTGEVGTIDPALLDLLVSLAGRTGARAPFQVISGFRSGATNEVLRGRSSGVASGSLHLRGQAIDIRVPGVALPALRDAALSLRRGGVGYYAASNFVHVDTGRVRAW